ncbi:hypothetical protein HDU76_007180, partial [Blyttiomyces sp. JEL0837]
DVSKNQHSGQIPDSLSNLPNLKSVDLGYNFFSGRIPTTAFSNSAPTLNTLSLGFNALTGSLPLSLLKLDNLKALFLDDNLFSGELPEDICSLLAVTDLRLNNNSFSGNIPSMLGSLRKLTNLRLDMNEFTGVVPEDLGNLTNLQSLNVSSNCLTGTLPHTLLGKFFGIGIQRTTCAAVSSTNSESSMSSIHIAAISVGVIGCVLMIGVIVALLLIYRKRKSGNHSVGSGKDNLQKHMEAGGVENSGNAIAARLVKNSNELNVPAYSSQTTSPSQTLPVPLISVTTGGYQSVSPNPLTSTQRSPNLFDMNASRPVMVMRETENDSKQMYAVDEKTPEFTIEIRKSESDGTNVEAVLQSQWGPYLNWSREQVTVWAKEKMFDEIVLGAFNRYEVDGTILHSLDREGLKSDLGIADIKIRAQILKSIELLKLAAAQSASVATATNATAFNSNLAPPRGVSRNGIVGRGSVEAVAPPAYNNA